MFKLELGLVALFGVSMAQAEFVTNPGTIMLGVTAATQVAQQSSKPPAAAGGAEGTTPTEQASTDRTETARPEESSTPVDAQAPQAPIDKPPFQERVVVGPSEPPKDIEKEAAPPPADATLEELAKDKTKEKEGAQPEHAVESKPMEVVAEKVTASEKRAPQSASFIGLPSIKAFSSLLPESSASSNTTETRQGSTVVVSSGSSLSSVSAGAADKIPGAAGGSSSTKTGAATVGSSTGDFSETQKPMRREESPGFVRGVEKLDALILTNTGNAKGVTKKTLSTTKSAALVGKPIAKKSWLKKAAIASGRVFRRLLASDQTTRFRKPGFKRPGLGAALANLWAVSDEGIDPLVEEQAALLAGVALFLSGICLWTTFLFFLLWKRKSRKS